MQIITKGLTYTYSEKSKSLAVHAITDINLTIEEGDFFGIVGHTGSGKSTFIQHLNGLIKLAKNHGEIRIGEFDLGDKKCDFKALRSKVGMVFQHPEYQLFAETVEEDIAFGVKNFMSHLNSEEVKNAVRSAMEYVGLDYEKYKDKSPFSLSGGQKRRVAIAGVIATHPEVLVLDEPVAGLDPQGKREFIELLKELKKRVVKTIIIVSHDMNLVAENCNKIAVFKEGKVFAVGSPKEVFSRAEEIKESGLELPLTASLTKALKDKGISIENDFTEQGFASALVQYFKGRGEGL